MDYDFKIIRSARRSISLSVSASNEIVVRCPRNTSQEKIEKLIKSKQGWLEKIIRKNAASIAENSTFTDYDQIYVGGERLPLYLGGANKITDSYVSVTSVKAVKRTFIKYFSERFTSSVRTMSSLTGLKCAEISYKSYRRRWGCCDAKGNITFNFIIFMLPAELQRYIIVHELCHTVYFNHSPSFWKLVGQFIPDCKALRKRLKNYDFLTELY